MLKRRLLVAFCFVMLLIVNALAAPADLSGNWEATVTGPKDTVKFTFTFDVKDDGFTGAVRIVNKIEDATGQITDGKINGDQVSFKVHIPIDNAPGVVSATGTLTGDQLKLTIEGEDANEGHRKMELTLTRKKAADRE